jgi:hypothetical protein
MMNIKMKKMKNSLNLKSVMCVLMLCSTVFSCNLFSEDTPKMLSSLKLGNRNFNISIYYIPANATSQNYIQIRKVYNDKHEEIYKNFERYQGINDLKVVNDSLFRVVVLDTMSYKTRVDTMIIKY